MPGRRALAGSARGAGMCGFAAGHSACRSCQIVGDALARRIVLSLTILTLVPSPRGIE
jgi:hypothetical protein